MAILFEGVKECVDELVELEVDDDAEEVDVEDEHEVECSRLLPVTCSDVNWDWQSFCFSLGVSTESVLLELFPASEIILKRKTYFRFDLLLVDYFIFIQNKI